MSIQVNIFNSGSVPTATELANFVNELNTDLDSIVTLNTEQVIEGVKTFWGSKMLKFKQKTTADKLGFTFYDNQGKEVGNFEYDNKNNFRLLALGNYYSATNQEIEGHVGFKVYNKSALSAYRLLCPLAGNAKNSIPSLTDTYTNFYMPLVFTNGALSVTTDNNGKVDLSTLIGSGGGGGDISGLATVATTGDYNDLLNRPILFSGNYNDLTNKPTLFSGSYGDLTDKPTLFSGDYNDLTNKPTIPTNLSDLSDDSTHRLVTDTEKATWNNKSDFSGSYNDLTNKPTIPTVPAISTNITSDAASDTKTASPKAVKDFVEGKGYLTQHQDISGKADQSDLESLEDRVEALEQGGGSTPTYSYLKLIDDLDAYLNTAQVGELAVYSGTTNAKYTKGWIYEKVESGQYPQGSTIVTSISCTNDVPEHTRDIVSNIAFPLTYPGIVKNYYSFNVDKSGVVFFNEPNKTLRNVEVGDMLLVKDGSGNTYEVTSVNTESNYITTNHPQYGTISTSSIYTSTAFYKTIDRNGNVVWIDLSPENYVGTLTGNLALHKVYFENEQIAISDRYMIGTFYTFEESQAIYSWQPIIMPTASN